MKKETQEWINFADENLKSAEVLFKNNLYNPCLQNIQQSIEKYLKAIIIEKENILIKTHNIRGLINKLKSSNIIINISDDDIDLIDSIYLPSKYPVFSVLPEYSPDNKISKHCMDIAMAVKNDTIKFIR